MNNNSSSKSDGEIRLIKTQEEWSQFIEMTKINFPEFEDILKNEKLEYHKQESRFLYGYFIDNKVAGSVGIQIEKQQELGLLGYFQVEREYQKKGIGKELYHFVKKKLKQLECRFISLWVNKDNKLAIKIYEKWGFKRVPLIYNVDYLKKNENTNTNYKFISKKSFIINEKQVERLIEETFEEYYYFNKVYHPLDAIYNFYLKKYVYTRKIGKITHLFAFNYLRKNIQYYQIFLLKQRNSSLIALEEEILEILSKKVKTELSIIIYGSLTKIEIIKIQKLGLIFRYPFESLAYLIEF